MTCPQTFVKKPRRQRRHQERIDKQDGGGVREWHVDERTEEAQGAEGLNYPP